MIYEFDEVGKEELANNVTKANASIIGKPRGRRMSIIVLERLFGYGTAGAALSHRCTAQRRDASQLKDQRRS